MADLHLGSMVIEDEGKGPCVVMVHGLGGTSNSFQTLLPALGNYRVLRIDLPGAGRSAYRPGVPGMQGMVAALSNALRSAGIDRAHLVGHSMGTLVCQYLAVNSPDVVASLVLFGGIYEPTPAMRQLLKERAETARKKGMAPIAEFVSTHSVGEASRSRNPVIKAFVRESLMRHNAMSYAFHCEALSEAEAADHQRIGCPTMLIAGEHDSVAPIAMSQKLAAKIENAKMEVISNIGHWHMMEAPKQCAELVREHLDGLKE